MDRPEGRSPHRCRVGSECEIRHGSGRKEGPPESDRHACAALAGELYRDRLSRMKFPYVEFRGSLTPIIPVALYSGHVCIRTEALVDSGAGKCIFDVQFANALGIDRIDDGIEIEFEAVSGHRLVGYQHTVDLSVGGNRFYGVDVAFSRDMPDNAVNILGQEGFFDLFPIKFTLRKREIELMAGSAPQSRA
jgi:Aspartyl protease